MNHCAFVHKPSPKPTKLLITMADNNNTGNYTLNNKHHIINLAHIQPFCAPPILSTRTWQFDFVWRNYHVTQFFDPTKVQQFWNNLPTSHLQSINGSDDKISCFFKICQDVVNNIMQNCRMHLHHKIYQRCKDINWFLPGAQESPWTMYGGYFVQNRTWYMMIVG